MPFTIADLGIMLYGLPPRSTTKDIDDQIRMETDYTARNIYNSINRIMTELKVTDVLQLYRRHKKVVDWVEGDDAPPSPASKVTFYNALSSVANPDKTETISIAKRVSERARKIFLQRGRVLARLVRAEQSKNKLDKRERVSILPWSEIQAAYNKNKHILNDSQRVIAALYLAGGIDPAGAPRRLDYNAVRILYKQPKKNAKNNPDNFIVVKSPRHVVLTLNEFKTVKHYGTFVTKLPGPVCRVINESITTNPRSWLVESSDGSPLTAANFGHRVAATLKRLTGRRIGASNLRKSFITWIHNNPDISEDMLEAYAKAMNHSPGEQKLYRRKDIEKSGGIKVK